MIQKKETEDQKFNFGLAIFFSAVKPTDLFLIAKIFSQCKTTGNRAGFAYEAMR